MSSIHISLNTMDGPLTAKARETEYGVTVEIRQGNAGDVVFLSFHDKDAKLQPVDARAALAAWLKPLVEWAVAHPVQDPAQLPLKAVA